MQKILPDNVADNLLKHVPGWDADRVGGFVTKAGDARSLDTPRQIYDGLRLDYKDTAFTPDHAMYAVRYSAGHGNHLDIPDGPVASRVGSSGKDAELPPPYTGNGFTASKDGLIPEYLAGGRLPDGAEMWRVQPDGSEDLVAVLRESGEGAKWISVQP